MYYHIMVSVLREVLLLLLHILLVISELSS